VDRWAYAQAANMCEEEKVASEDLGAEVGGSLRGVWPVCGERKRQEADPCVHTDGVGR
jgi:hypothetical protein